MLKIYLLIFMLLFSKMNFATTWGGPGSDYSTQLIRTSDNGMLLLGGYTNSSEDYYLIKFDSTLAVQWIQSFGDTGIYEFPICITESSDHGYFIGGQEFSNYSATLVRTDSLGNPIWSKNFSNDPNALFDIVFVEQTKPDQLTIALRKSPLTGGTTMYLCYADTSGNISDTIATINSGSGVIHSSGGYLITGTVQGPLPEYITLTRVDTSGGNSFTKNYSDPNLNLEFRSYFSAPSASGYLTSGTSNYFSANPSVYEFFLLQTDSAGDSIKTNHWGNFESELGHIISSGNNFYVTGSVNNSGTPDNQLMKLDNNADTVWTIDLGPDLYPDWLLDLSGGFYAVAGDSTDQVSGYTDIWMITFDSLGNIQNNISTKIKSPVRINNPITVTPNPSTDFISFTINNHPNDHYKVMITDASGRLIFENEINIKERLDIRSFKHGVYFIRISDENGTVIGVSKILKQ
jgi:hypothetical protein